VFRTDGGETLRITSDITDLRRAEERLREAINAIPDSLAIFDRDDRMAMCNEPYRRHTAELGLDPGSAPTFADIIRKSWDRHGAAAYPGIDGAAWIEARRKVHRAAGGDEITRTADGRYYRTSVSRMRNGETVRLVSDITDLRRAEQRLVDAINALPDEFAIYDRDDRLAICNEPYRRLLAGIGLADAVAPTIHEVLNAAWSVGGREIPGRGDKESWMHGRLLSGRRMGMTYDRSFSGRDQRILVSRTDGGETVRLITDITELRRIEDELRRSMAEIRRLSEAELAKRNFLLQSVMDSLPAALAILDEGGGATFWNYGFLKMAGLVSEIDSQSLGPMLGIGLAELLRAIRVPPDSVSSLLAAGIEGVDVSDADGRVLHLRLLEAGSGSRLLVAEDMTAERRKTREQLAVQERLLQSQKMEALGSVAGTVAHDINNILAIVLGAATLSLDQTSAARKLMEELSLGGLNSTGAGAEFYAGALANLDKWLNSIVTGAKRGRDLVRNLNEFAGGQPSEFEPADVLPTIQSAARLSRMLLPSSVNVTLDMSAASLSVMHDRGRIEQAVLNLCINSGHAFEGRPGQMTLSLSEVDVVGDRADFLRRRGIGGGTKPAVVSVGEDGTAELWRNLLKPGRYARIRVQDNGVGMSAEVLERILDPFFTTRAGAGGTGLGLASVSSIVDMHGGAIHVRSRRGAGTSFSLLLPVTPLGTAVPKRETEQEADILRGDRQSASEQQQKIIVVDDESDILDLLREMLLRAGYTVETFVDPAKAFERIKEGPGAFDLVIADQTMPDMTGVMLARAIHELRPTLRCLICTAHATQFQSARQWPDGVVGVIPKPFEAADVERIVSSALRNGTGAARAVAAS
jgi:signal transduction histidine kinase/ActR/RegA family two-component response regulator